MGDRAGEAVSYLTEMEGNVGGEGRRRKSRTSNSDAPSSKGPMPEPGLKSKSSVLTMLIKRNNWIPLTNNRVARSQPL